MSRDTIYDTTRYSSSINNPCMKERSLSLKCLDDNNYEQEACALYFDNYKNCRKFWSEVELSRRRRGIQPHLPDPVDRERIKKEYIDNLKK